MKTCSRCKANMELANFSRSKAQADGMHNVCKSCTKQYNDANKEKAWARNLKSRYGITPEQYEAMFIAQNGCCKICGTDDPGVNGWGKRTRFAVDHDHATGNVRALLCSPCNGMLGLANDNTSVLRNAIQYLEEHA